MAKKKIVSVGVDIPGGQSKSTYLKSKLSLLDFDIAIFNPTIFDFYYMTFDDYMGKPCLSDTNSFELKEHLEHWRREIADAVRSGKTVFVLLNSVQEVYIATGEKTFSGTGRNQRTIRNVVPYNNYKMIPASIDFVNSKGSSMKLHKSDNILSSYWAGVKDSSEYRVLLSGEGLRPLVITRTGNKIVGGYIKQKDSTGSLVMLPYIDFDREDFTYEKDEKMFWKDEAVALGSQFISSLVQIDKFLIKEGESTPIPVWANQQEYELPKETKIREKLLSIESKMELLQKDKEKQLKLLSDESILRGLLYEKGKPLEFAILEALNLLGFTTSQYRDSESEFDVVFESKEGRIIGEAEGKDSKPISIDKLRQLEMNIHEDFDRDEVLDMAKGALIGNAFRLTAPNERGDFFTDKCLTASLRSKTALIKSIDLFLVAHYLSAKSDKIFAKKCRAAILGAAGVVKFPKIPKTGLSKTETIVSQSSNGTNT